MQRRNLTAGQKAIAAAEALQRFGGSAVEVAAQFGVSDTYVGQAKALLESAPDAAAAVKAGTAALTPTYEALREAEEARDRDANVATAREEEAQLAVVAAEAGESSPPAGESTAAPTCRLRFSLRSLPGYAPRARFPSQAPPARAAFSVPPGRLVDHATWRRRRDPPSRR